MRRLSLVVITRNRRALLEESIPHHLKSLPAGSEAGDLIVVDNASTDDTARWLRRNHPEVTVVSLIANAGPAGRNVGVAMATTRHVAFSDDDSWWEPGSLDRMCDALDAHPRVALRAGSVALGPEQRPDPMNRVLAESPIAVPDPAGVPILGFMAFAAVVRRDAFLAVGGFPIGLAIGSEEQWLAMGLAAAGWDLRYDAEAVAVHNPQMADDRSGRAALQVKNALAVVLARRRGAGLVDGMTAAVTSSDGVSVVRQLVEVAPWSLRHRRPLPDRVEQQFRTLDRARATEGAALEDPV